jgi:phospholipid/cholesterol/gamma-HCH transport system permease protein
MSRQVVSMEKPNLYINAILYEIVSMGIGSTSIVLLTSLFIGAVMTVQTAYQLQVGFFPPSVIGSVVSATGLLEMAPTLTALLMAGKVGSNIAAEIGTMRVSEQIDAMDVMGINSASLLVFPKVISGLIAFPILVAISATMIHVGGMVAGELTGALNLAQFQAGVVTWHNDFYVTFMFIKAFTFGFIITSVSAYQGYYVVGGAIEVGKASTRAVVNSCTLVVTADYLLAQFLL